MAAVVTDLLSISHALASNAVEDVLRGRRIMLQDLQTKRRSPRVRREKLVQELAVELLETGLRRRGPPATT